MIIATRTLTVKTKANADAPVAIRLYLPEPEGNAWFCRYEIDWPEDGWPAETRRSYAGGADAMQALQLALQKLGLDLHFASYHDTGAMRWNESWEGYGFALPRDARDMLRGDDAKFYG